MEKTAQARCQRLRRQFKKLGIEAMLVSDPANVRYLTGFTGDSSYLLLSREHGILISDTRFETQMAQQCAGFDVEIRDASTTTETLAAKIIARLRAKSLAVEADWLTKSAYDRITGELKGTQVADTTGVVKALRAIKDKQEIAVMRQAVRVAERAIQVILAQLKGDQTEKVIAYNLEHEIRSLGGEGCSFPPIVAVGANAALPHAHPGEGTIGSSPFVLIDWGAKLSGYCSDLTRVYLTAKILPKFRRIFQVVMQAQQAAIDQIRPGADLQKVDAAARTVIARAGFDKYFGHGLGHGLGLEVHELPRISPASNGTLQAGMVVTIEPGIYLPDFGGVRIEDDVLVTPDGYELLSEIPRDIDACQVAV